MLVRNEKLRDAGSDATAQDTQDEVLTGTAACPLIGTRFERMKSRHFASYRLSQFRSESASKFAILGWTIADPHLDHRNQIRDALEHRKPSRVERIELAPVDAASKNPREIDEVELMIRIHFQGDDVVMGSGGGWNQLAEAMILIRPPIPIRIVQARDLVSTEDA